ncbi:MAG: hypothetical protein IPK07_20350 [Deltaproteobacteria bacterium]|nr:hypothetical protein [Deltaproteobacteria bacterium]
MSAGRAYKSAVDAFDFFEVSVVCRDCDHSDGHHLVRTWWSAPNRTAGWDAPTTSGTTYSVGATLKGLSAQRTRFGGESRCNGCGATMKWAIITDRSRVVSISLSDPLEPLRLVVRDHHHAPASRGVTDTHPSSS